MYSLLVTFFMVLFCRLTSIVNYRGTKSVIVVTLVNSIVKFVSERLVLGTIQSGNVRDVE